VVGCAIFLVLVGFAYTGYLLAGDARAYAGMTVMSGVAEATPVLGGALGAIVRGGNEISSTTIARLYTVHTVVLPFALVALVAAYVVVWRRRNAPAPLVAQPRKESYATLALLGVLALLAWVAPPALGPKLDPLETAADARPEWFFLWVNELLHRFGAAPFLVAAVVPGALVALAAGAPWIARRAGARTLRVTALVVAVAIAGLSVASLARPGDGPEEPAETAAPTAEGDMQVDGVMRTFRCRNCHVIDGEGDETGPALFRDGTATLPPFRELYARAFFRRKIADPQGFWKSTIGDESLSVMTYPKRAGLPSEADVAALEKWFYRD
jgi:hypothetical protein